MNKELTPKFQDGEKVLLDGEIVTVKEWSYAQNLRRYTYTIVEYPGEFYFEHEIKKGYKALDIDKLKNKKCTIISSEEALRDIIPMTEEDKKRDRKQIIIYMEENITECPDQGCPYYYETRTGCILGYCIKKEVY